MSDFYAQLELLRPDTIAVAGVPFDAYSSFLRGPAGAPAKIWEAFHSPSANYYTESLTDLQDHPQLHYLGDMPLEEYFDIERYAREILQRGARLFALGGDHSVSFPLVKAQAERFGPLTIVHLDAHTDLYDDFEGNPYSHASPFARIMEAGLARRLIQIGIRTMTLHHREQAARFGVEIHTMDRWQGPPRLELSGPVYLSLDLDVLDPAFAPGISHYEPGGLSTREVLQIIQALPRGLVGADLVEYNPDRDREQVTAMVAAKFFKEVFVKLLD